MRDLLLAAIRVSLNVAISAVLMLWVLSRWSGVLTDVGSNSCTPKGVGFTSSPKGIKFLLLDRAWITNAAEIVNINESRSGWDWDVMQRLYERQWTLPGVSIWYRTRQCLAMFAITYPTAIISIVCMYALVVRGFSRYSRAGLVECKPDTA